MKEAARAIFAPFTARLEGRVYTMYLDVKGLVTIGYGCLIDPVHLATSLPFVHAADGSPATPVEIVAEWHILKARQDLSKLHWKYAAKLLRLRLTAEGACQLLDDRIRLFERQLTKVLPQYPDWPANAQLATMSMAWAMGAGFVAKFPSWAKAAKAQNWEECAKQCLMRTAGNPGLIPRNRANQALFRAALTGNPDKITLEATGL